MKELLKQGVANKWSKPVILECQEKFLQELESKIKSATSPEDVLEKLMLSETRKIMIYPGFASGDMYAVGIAMSLDKNLNLLLMQSASKGYDSTNYLIRGKEAPAIDKLQDGAKDYSKSTIAYLKEVLGSDYGNRVHVVNIDTLKSDQQYWGSHWGRTERDTGPTSKNEDKLIKMFTHLLDTKNGTNVVQNWVNSSFILVDLFYGTEYVRVYAKNKGPAAVHKRAKETLLHKENETLIEKWLGEYTQKQLTLGQAIESAEMNLVENKKALVIWSRYSGKRGGAHIEYDTGFKGLQQMILVAAWMGYGTVFIAGDLPGGFKKEIGYRLNKMKTMLESMQKITSTLNIYNITEFWNDDGWKDTSEGKRLMQYDVYSFIDQQYDTTHVGHRSGNLENLALMGFKIGYMELYDDAGRDRMLKFNDLGYQRIMLAFPSSRTGKHITYEAHGKKGPEGLDTGHPAYTHRNRKIYEDMAQGLKTTFNEHKVDNPEKKKKYSKPDVSTISKGYYWKDLLGIAEWLEKQLV